MFDFSVTVDRKGSWCTQWDYVKDRFAVDDLLPFTISDMDFASAPCVIAALQKRLAHGVLGYSRWQHEAFLGAVRHWYTSRFHCDIDEQVIVYAPSVIYMLAQLIRQWSRPGDSVVMHTPAYDAFYKTITHNQRQILSVPLIQQGHHWQCDMEQLERLLARPGTRILLLCNPHNPTGKVWQREELQHMAALCERYHVRVISDEIHMDMTWQNQSHIPWHQVGQGIWAILTSASKSFNIPALTGAYGLINEHASRADYFCALKSRDGLSSPAVLAICAHIAAYRQGQPWLDALRAYLQDNLCWLAHRLNSEFPSLNWQPPQATYLAWIDIRSLAIEDDVLQQRLIYQEKIAIMPGTIYGNEGKGFLRLNVGCPRSKLECGVDGLIRALRALAKY